MKSSKILTLVCILLALVCVFMTACKKYEEPTETNDPAEEPTEQNDEPIVENADGSITVKGLPEGYEWNIIINNDSQSHQITDPNGKIVYGEYVPNEDEIFYDAGLSATLNLPIYRVSDAYAVKDSKKVSYVKIGKYYYNFYQASTKNAAFMISLDEFLGDPTVAGIPAETTLSFENEYQIQSDDEFLYNNEAYHSYGMLKFSANNGVDIYEVRGCMINGEFYILGEIQNETYYVVAKRVTNITPTFDKTLENVLYSSDGTITTGNLDIYSITTEVRVPTYVAKVNGRYYGGIMDDSGEIYFEGLFGVSAYGLETKSLPDGNTLYVFGSGEGRKYAGSDATGAYEAVAVTYGYVKAGNFYAVAYTDGNTVVYPGIISFPTIFRSYEQILRQNNLYGLQNGTYQFSAKLLTYFKENYKTSDGYLTIKLEGTLASDQNAEKKVYEFKIAVPTAPKNAGYVSFDYQDYFNNDIRWVVEPDTNSVAAVVPNNGNGIRIQMENGNIPANSENADYEPELSTSSGFEVYSYTVRNDKYADYLLINGKYYEYNATSTDQYSPQATFDNLKQLIVIKELKPYENDAYQWNVTEERYDKIEDAVYEISFDGDFYQSFFAQIHDGKLWILIDAKEDSDGKTLKFKEDAVSYADFLASIEIGNGNSSLVDNAKLPDEKTTISRKSNIELSLNKSPIGIILDIYYYVSGGKNIYFTNYNQNSKITAVEPGDEEVTDLPADFAVTSTDTQTIGNSTYTFVRITWHEISKNYVVKIDGKLYAANLDDGNIQLSGNLILEDNLNISGVQNQIDSAIEINGVWYEIEWDYEDSLIALGDPVEGEVTYFESYESSVTVEEKDYEVYCLECEISDYAQTEWNGKTAYRKKDGTNGYVEIINDYFVEVQFDGDEVVSYPTLEQIESVDRQSIDLSAYIENVDGNVIRLKKGILSVLEKYNATQLVIESYSISLADLKITFGVSE